jgi:hypothetical protein
MRKDIVYLYEPGEPPTWLRRPIREERESASGQGKILGTALVEKLTCGPFQTDSKNLLVIGGTLK